MSCFGKSAVINEPDFDGLEHAHAQANQVMKEVDVRLRLHEQIDNIDMCIMRAQRSLRRAHACKDSARKEQSVASIRNSLKSLMRKKLDLQLALDA